MAAICRFLLPLASAQVLRGSRLAQLPSCSGKPNFQLARTAWCGEQLEPVACYKPTDSRSLAKEGTHAPASK